MSKSPLERAGVAFYLLVPYLNHGPQPEIGAIVYNTVKEGRLNAVNYS